MKILFLRDRTLTTASTASNLTIIATGNQCFDIIMLQPYHQELLVSFSFAGTAFLRVVEEESLFKICRSPELRITRQFDHNCVCTRGAKR